MDLIQPCSQNVCFLCGIGRHPETEMGWFMSTGLKPRLSVLNFVAQLCRDKIQKGKLRFKASLACAHVNHATYTKCSCWILVFLLGDCQSIMKLVELTEYDRLKQKCLRHKKKPTLCCTCISLLDQILLPSVHMRIQSEIISLSVGYFGQFDMKSEKRSRTTWYR